MSSKTWWHTHTAEDKQRKREREQVREQKAHSISHRKPNSKLIGILFACPLKSFDEENNRAARYFNLFGIFDILCQIETMWSLNANPPYSPWIPIHRIIIQPKKCHNQKALFSVSIVALRLPKVENVSNHIIQIRFDIYLPDAIILPTKMLKVVQRITPRLSWQHHPVFQ